MNKSMNYPTIPKMFLEVCTNHSNKDEAIKYKIDGQYQAIDYDELKERVEAFAVGLINLGIRKGDRVGLVSENRVEWIISDLALAGIGAISVPLFPNLSPIQEKYIFNDCDAVAVIVSNKFQLNKLLEIKEDLPTLRQTIVLNDIDSSEELQVKSFEYVCKRARSLKNIDERSAIYKSSMNKVEAQDILTLIYTSGTTGSPKGVMLTHKNVLSNVSDALKVIDCGPSDTFLSYLPLCHAYERSTGYYVAFSSGATIALAESLDTIAVNMQEIKPTLITTVPKLLEIIQRKIYKSLENEKPSKRAIFNWAIENGRKIIESRREGKKSILQSLKFRIADVLVFSKLREKTGGRLRMFVSGGAALSIDTCEFFLAAGFTVIEGYGLTEASPIISVNRPNEIEPGTVGKPLHSVEIKIAEDGELLARGPNIMKGYWKDKVATYEAIDDEGWLYTGDIARLTENGNIKITDRKKFIFINKGGKNIAPQPLELLISASPYIEHCVLIGDNREFVTALISPIIEEIRNYADNLGIEFSSNNELIERKEIHGLIKTEIDRLQKDFAKFERIRRFKLLSEPFTVENGHLTPKLSIKRHAVERNYSDLIEQMYGLTE